MNVICIEGGTHGGIYNAIPGSKWNRRKWTIGASQQQYFDLFGNENNVYIEKQSKYQEKKLPKSMNTQQYRDKIGKYASMFMFNDKNVQTMFLKLNDDSKTYLSPFMNALNILDSLIQEFAIKIW